MSRAAGLDIGTKFAKAVVVERSARGLAVVGFALEAIPRNAEGGPEFGFLPGLLRRAGWRSEPIAAALPAQETAVREITVPFTNPEQLAKVVRFEAENYLPFPIEEATLEYLPLRSGTEGTCVMAFAARKALLEESLRRLEEAGVDPQRLGVEPMALLEALAATGNLPETPTLLLDLGCGSAKAVWVENSKLVAARILRFGAELDSATPEQSARYAEKLARELRLFLAGAPHATEGTRALLFGGNARPEVAESLGKALEIPAAEFIPGEGNTLGGEMTPQFQRQGMTALGLALPLLQPAQFPVNLRSGEFRYRAKIERIRAPLMFCLGAWAVLMALCAAGMEWRRHDALRVDDALFAKEQAIWQTVEPGKPLPSDLGAWMAAEMDRLRSGAAVTGQNASALATLRAILGAIPPTIEVTVRSVTILPEQARIEMAAKSHSDAAAIVKGVASQTGLNATPRNLRYEGGLSVFELDATPKKEAPYGR